VARLGFRAADDAARLPERLEPVRAAPPPVVAAGAGGGSRANLGTIPDFEERKEPGVLLAGVRPGSPAEQAGLLAGDVLLQVGTQRILNLQDLQYALQAYRPGDQVELAWTRQGQARRGRATLGERR